MRGSLRLLWPVALAALAAPGPWPVGAQVPRASVGLRSGPLMGRTDLTDRVRGSGEVFARGRLASGLELEASVGYGRLEGAGFATDLALSSLRLVLAAPVSGRWQPLVWAGAAAQRHDIDTWPASRTGDARSIAWSAGVPAGVGLRRVLGPRAALEVYGSCTYTLRDDLDGRVGPEGTDWLLSAGLGLAFGPFGPVLAGRRAGGPAAADRDGDGLSDWAETRQWFTNPARADSDGDGLSDRDEVVDHRTSPNRLDTDGDGVWDGAEVRAGTDPLVADAATVGATAIRSAAAGPRSAADGPVTARRPAAPAPDPATGFRYPTISFASGGAALDAAARAALDRVAEHLAAHPEARLEVRGYSDALGSWQDNLRLSGRRCAAVRDYLMARDVEGGQLAVKAVGEANPVADNGTLEGRRANRRVELVPLP